MKNLNSKNSFYRVFTFALASSLKSIKLYLFILLIPLFVYLFSYLYVSSFDKVMINPAIMLSKLVLPSIFSIFMVTTLISDWEHSMFNKLLKLFKLNRFKYLLALIIVFLVIDVLFTLAFFVEL